MTEEKKKVLLQNLVNLFTNDRQSADLYMATRVRNRDELEAKLNEVRIELHLVMKAHEIWVSGLLPLRRKAT